jgi:hypothetical protein
VSDRTKRPDWAVRPPGPRIYRTRRRWLRKLH